MLARLTVNGERRDLAVMKLIELCGLMASMMESAEARVCIAETFRSEADPLAPPVDRRLH